MDIIDQFEHFDIEFYSEMQISPKILEKLSEDSKINDRTQHINRTQKYQCSSCQETKYIIKNNSKGYYECENCGEVMGTIYLQNAEWTNYENGTGGHSRCSGTTNFFLPQSSLSTTIMLHPKNKILKIHNWNSMPYKERTLHKALSEITEYCNILGVLQCVIDDAKIYYKKLSECKYTSGKNEGRMIIRRGKNKKGLIAACPYYACKKHYVATSIQEIAIITNLSKKIITFGLKTFKILAIKSNLSYDFLNNTPKNYLVRYCKYLNISQDNIKICKKIAKNVLILNAVSRHAPLSVASALALILSDHMKLGLSKKYIASIFQVSEVTINTIYKKLKKMEHIITDQLLTLKYKNLIENKLNKTPVSNCLLKSYMEVNTLLKMEHYDFSQDVKNPCKNLDLYPFKLVHEKNYICGVINSFDNSDFCEKI